MQNLADAGSALTGGPLAPAWLVMPVAMLSLLVVAGHVLAIHKAEMPASRKRIRTVNGLLMMFTIPLVAYAFGIATPQTPRIFVMVWTIVAGLVILVLLLAMADVANTWRLHWEERRTIRRQVAQTRAQLLALQGAAKSSGGAVTVRADRPEPGEGDGRRAPGPR